MNIYLIRHTSVAISPGICYGQSDVDVADTFKNEAQIIENQISKINFDKLYSSPLLRCKKLSEYLFSSDIIYDDRLMELNFGEWELQEWDKIKHPDINRWMTDFVNTSCPNGESFIELHNRVNSFLLDIQSKHLENIVIITHGGVIRSFIAHIQNKDLKNAFKRDIKYGKIINIEF